MDMDAVQAHMHCHSHEPLKETNSSRHAHQITGFSNMNPWFFNYWWARPQRRPQCSKGV